MKKHTKTLIIILLALLLVATSLVAVACKRDPKTVTMTVDFGLNGVDNQSIKVDVDASFADKLANLAPTDTGYTFGGWFMSDGSQVTDGTVAPGEDFTVKAKWFVTYSVEYWLQKMDSSEYELATELSGSNFGELGSTVTAEIKTIEGFTLDTSNASTVTGAQLTQAGVVLKLYYKRNTVTISFNANLTSATGSMASITDGYGKEITLPECSYVSPFTFTGWNTSADGTGTSYAEGDKLLLTSDLTLYAQWKSTYRVIVYVENPDYRTDTTVQRYLLHSEQTFDGMVGQTVTADVANPDSSLYALDTELSTLTGVIGEDGLTLTVYFSFRLLTITYMDDNHVDSVAYGSSYTVRIPANTDPNSRVLSYSTSATGNGRDYPFGTVIESVEQDYVFYPVIIDVFHDQAGSGDTVEIRRNMTGKGSAVLVKGGVRYEGYVTIDGDLISFDVFVGDNQVFGKLLDGNKFRYRNEEEVGTYILYEQLTGNFQMIMLALDGYGTGTWGQYDQYGERLMFYYMSYEATSEGDYYTQYFLPADPSVVYEDYFKIVREKSDDLGYGALDGYFMWYDYEANYMYYLYYNGEILDQVIGFDGYGNAELYDLVLSANGASYELVSTSKGMYFASENYTYDEPEYIYIPNGSNEGFYFILIFLPDTSGNTYPLFMVKRGEAGIYTMTEGVAFPELYLDGYSGAMYRDDASDDGRMGIYTIISDGNGYLVSIEFYDEIGGTMLVRLNKANNTFTLDDGFVIENGILTDYLGNSSVIVIPEGVVEIAANVFNSVNITSVTFPTTLKKIGDYAFSNGNASGGSYLRTATFLGTTPPELGADVFRWIKGNFKIIVPDGAEQAYRTAASWTAATPSQPNGYAQFVTSVAEQNNKPEFEIVNGVLVSYNNKSVNPTNVSIKIPDEATEIAKGVFTGLTYLVSVDLNNVTVIGDNAFYGCTELTTVKFNKNTVSVGDSAFYECKKLASVDLGEVVTIGKNAFNRCFALKEVIIGSKIQSIGDLAFRMCAQDVNEDETEFVMHELIVTIAATTPPTLEGAVFQGSQPRVYVQSYDVGMAYAEKEDISWARYATALRVKNNGAEETWYAKTNMGCLLILGDRAMFDESYLGLYKWQDGVLYISWFEYSALTQSLLIIDSQLQIVNNQLVGLYFDDIYGVRDTYEFVKYSATLTYKNGSETLEITFGTNKGKYNGQDVNIEIVNYRTQFTYDGYVYKLTLNNDLTFYYTRDKIVITTTYTAADGSTINVYYGNSTLGDGTLKNVDGLEKFAYYQGWYMFELSENVYWFNVYHLSTTYRIVVYLNPTNNTFTYEWSVGAKIVTYRADNGDLAIITEQADGTVSSIHLLFVTSNGTEEDNTVFTKVSDTVYTVTIDALVVITDDDGNVYTQPSEFNGTYTLTLDKTNNTFTLEQVK